MRTRQEIEEESEYLKGVNVNGLDSRVGLQIEVLLDIRDLMVEMDDKLQAQIDNANYRSRR